MPLIGRHNRHGVDIIAGEQFAEVVVCFAVRVAVFAVDLALGSFADPLADVARGHVLHIAPAEKGALVAAAHVADADAALECVKQFDEGPACVIVKHANPCGVAIGATLLEAYDRAYSTDPESAFGGIIAFNQALDALVRRLRDRLAETQPDHNFIITVRGHGLRLDNPLK